MDVEQQSCSYLDFLISKLQSIGSFIIGVYPLLDPTNYVGETQEFWRSDAHRPRTNYQPLISKKNKQSMNIIGMLEKWIVSFDTKDDNAKGNIPLRIYTMLISRQRRI